MQFRFYFYRLLFYLHVLLYNQQFLQELMLVMLQIWLYILQ